MLKNDRAKAVRFTTLDAICRTLECQPGDVLRWVPDDEDGHPAGSTEMPTDSAGKPLASRADDLLDRFGTDR